MEDNVNSINNIFGLICDTSSESIISIDSLLTSLNHIHSYESFLQYKTHLLHTMNDIKDSLQYINDLSYRQIHHTQNEPSCDNTPKTQLEFTSKSLGLKYNYDEYLSKMFPINNQSPNLTVDTSGLAYNYELPKATSSVQRNYEYVPKDKQISQREQEHEHERVINNNNNNVVSNNNTSNNKQYQETSVPSQIPSVSVAGGVNHNNNNNNNKNNEQDKENTPQQQQQQQPSPNIVQDLPPTPKQQRPNAVVIKQNIINPKKKKVARVTDLVTKINSDQELYDLTVQLFGENILDKLMSPTTEDIFIENVEKTVEEIERLRSNDTESSNINNNNNTKLSSQRIPIKHSLRNQLLNPSHTPKEENNIYQELPDTKPSQDEEATRAYADELLAKSGLLERFPKTPQSAVNKSVKGKEKKKQVITGYKSSGEMYYHPKIFMNYMSQYGQYFDSSLQHGGNSKLPPYDKRKNRKVVSPVRKYIYSASNKDNNA